MPVLVFISTKPPAGESIPPKPVQRPTVSRARVDIVIQLMINYLRKQEP
jgi:hypothetical protein